MKESVTSLLRQWHAGDAAAIERLTPLVYEELRRLAGAYLRRERADHTLQATALVHEVYLELASMAHYDWKNRAHFIGIVANVMRRILVDYAREHNAQKRSGGNIKVSISQADRERQASKVDLVELDDILKKFETEYPRQARVVELKFFGGMTIDEIANTLSVEGENISTATIERDWRFARAWLRTELSAV